MGQQESHSLLEGLPDGWIMLPSDIYYQEVFTPWINDGKPTHATLHPLLWPCGDDDTMMEKCPGDKPFDGNYDSTRFGWSVKYPFGRSLKLPEFNNVKESDFIAVGSVSCKV